ncbi:MAG: hypothetical protein AABX11_05165 [Nanoarchaeota archaeon]
MPECKTLFQRIERRDRDRAVIHHIDQFWWFAEGMNVGDAEGSRESAVDFMLPFGGRLSVVGEPCEYCAYFFGPKQSLQENGLWKVFEYNSDEFKQIKSGLIRKPIEEYDARRFTTNIIPFLHIGGIPSDFERRYMINLIGSDYLEIVAKRGESSAEEDTFKLIAHPDARDAEPYEVVAFSIKNRKWFSNQLDMK